MASKLLSGFIGTYDPDEVSILINDEEVFGFAEGEMVTVEKNEAHFNTHVGAKGETTRAAIRDNNYTITIRLQQTSPFVDELEKYKLFNSVPILPPIWNLKIKDPSSFDGFFSAQAWLQEDPSRSWGSDVGVREYTFFAVGGITSDDKVKGALNFAFDQGII